MTEDEYKKLRKELESDYLALFKKTVAMHEIYLLRIAAHTKLREDSNFRVFLEYAKDVSLWRRIFKNYFADIDIMFSCFWMIIINNMLLFISYNLMKHNPIIFS